MGWLSSDASIKTGWIAGKLNHKYDMPISSQAKNTFLEGSETTGEV